jgi:hypothetical protein
MNRLHEALRQAVLAMKDGSRCLDMASRALNLEHRYQEGGEAHRAAARLRCESTAAENAVMAFIRELGGDIPGCSECGKSLIPYRGGQRTCGKARCQQARHTRLQRERRQSKRKAQLAQGG